MLRVYGPPGTSGVVARLVRALAPLSRIDAGSPDAGRDPGSTVRAVEVGRGQAFTVGSVTVRTVENSHYVTPCGAGASGVPLSLSLRFEAAGRVIDFTGDTGPCEAVERLARGADLLVSEMLDTDAQIAVVRRPLAARGPTYLAGVENHLRRHHLNPTEVGELAARAGVKQLVVTHLGPGTQDPFDGPVTLLVRPHGYVPRRADRVALAEARTFRAGLGIGKSAAGEANDLAA